MRVPAANKNKYEPWREIPIRNELVSVLTTWRKIDQKAGVEHVINYYGKPVTTICWAWLMIIKRSGISRHIRPYDLRHAFATEAIAAGADYGTVAKLMRHQNPIMIMTHYQHVMNNQKRAAVDSLPMPDLPQVHE